MQRIFVVDDSATIRRVVKRTLGQAGYDVSTATDGREALERLEREAPDLVLVDYVMPHMDGLAFILAMRQIDNFADVPVVLMSAKTDAISDELLHQTRAVDAIHKPFSPDALLTVTQHAFTRLAARPAALRLGPNLTEPIGRPAESPLRLMDTTEVDEDAEALIRAEDAAEVVRSALVTLVSELDELRPNQLFERVRRLAGLLPEDHGEIALWGQLEHAPLGEVLQLLTYQRQDGVLEVEKRPSASARSISVCLRNGCVDLALGRTGEQEFRLGRYLLHEGLIAREELERILAGSSHENRWLGARLVKQGVITADELRRVLVQQTSELVYEALRWPTGQYRFLRFASRPQAEEANLGLPLANLLMEGLRRVDEWRLIEEQIESFDDVPRCDFEALRAFEIETLEADERRVLDAVDGVRNVREIIAHSELAGFDACKILFQLSTSRLIRLSPGPSR